MHSDENEGDYDDAMTFDDEMSTVWNLRKCAAAALDAFAISFDANLLNVSTGIYIF